MRTALVAVILSATIAPALAIDMEVYRAARSAERTAALDSENARRRAVCAKLGGVRVGLDAAGVRKSCWGSPIRINTTQTANHAREQWVYDAGYVYLTDGLVTAIQTGR